MENIRKIAKKRGTTLFLRAALLGIACVVLFFSSFMVASVYSSWAEQNTDVAGWRYPIIFVVTAAVIALFVALGQLWRLLGLVDKNKAFSGASVRAMRSVKICGFVISGLFAVLLPLVYYIAQGEDAPGLLLLYGTVFVVVPFVVAILAGVAQKLFQNAIDIKKENDLTV